MGTSIENVILGCSIGFILALVYAGVLNLVISYLLDKIEANREIPPALKLYYDTHKDIKERLAAKGMIHE